MALSKLDARIQDKGKVEKDLQNSNLACPKWSAQWRTQLLGVYSDGDLSIGFAHRAHHCHTLHCLLLAAAVDAVGGLAIPLKALLPGRMGLGGVCCHRIVFRAVRHKPGLLVERSQT